MRGGVPRLGLSNLAHPAVVPLSAPGMRMFPPATTATDCIQIVASLLAREVPPAGCASIDVVAFAAARLHPLPQGGVCSGHRTDGYTRDDTLRVLVFVCQRLAGPAVGPLCSITRLESLARATSLRLQDCPVGTSGG